MKVAKVATKWAPCAITIVYNTSPLLKDLDEKNPLVLIGWTNNSLQNSYQEIFEHFETELHSLCEERPASITTIPSRYDRPVPDPVHNDLTFVDNY